MSVRRSNRPVAWRRIQQVAVELLESTVLCAVATVSPGSSAHVNTVYFAWSPAMELAWVSDPAARHSRNIHARPGVAVAVYPTDQVWGEPDRGLQLFGSAHRVARRESAGVDEIYAARFPGYDRAALAGYRFYRLPVERLKVFHERALGSGVFVTARVGPDRRPVWDGTEVVGGAA
jgi:uncharacterized protein YhbP (UPF0306 family)